jgi:hypothetical protein
VNYRKPRELDVASANHHSLLGSHEVPARPWFCGSTKKPSTDFILLFLPPCGAHMTPLAARSFKRSLLVFSTPGGLTGNDLPLFVLHLHQHESSRNLHLQYLAKNQSTQRCQSLITQGSDHPPVLEPHMVLNLPLDECINNTHDL